MERYWPGVRRADVATAEEHLSSAADELTRDGIPIRILSSTWIPADEVVLTLFETGEEDDVLEVSRLSDYPFDRMQRVEVVTEASRRWRGDEGAWLRPRDSTRRRSRGCARRMRGQLLGPGETGYDEARRVWNGTVDRRPALIARCADVADVQRALGFAVEHDLPVAVRGGGHSVAGFSTCDDGVAHRSGPDAHGDRRCGRTCRAGRGWGQGADVDRATQEHGLATTLGVVSDTGIAGLTLGGGIGWLMRKHGLACDNLLSVDLVTADGRLVTASADENPDLFWGLKGGGGNFGIVTSFEYRLHPVGPTVYGGSVAFATEHRRAVLKAYRELTRKAPDELTTYTAMTAAPDGSPVAAMAACYAGDPAEGARLLDPIKAAVGEPLLDALGPLTYTEQQSRMDAAIPTR